MATYCPDKHGPALYPECLECENKTCQLFFCLVVGSRDFTNYGFLKTKLDHLLQNHNKVAIVSGGASGADALAERYAKEKGYPTYIFPADWKQYGKAAGPIRNEEMHRFIAHFPRRGVVAFWDGKSKGTGSNIPLAEKYQNRIIIVNI